VGDRVAECGHRARNLGEQNGACSEEDQGRRPPVRRLTQGRIPDVMVVAACMISGAGQSWEKVWFSGVNALASDGRASRAPIRSYLDARKFHRGSSGRVRSSGIVLAVRAAGALRQAPAVSIDMTYYNMAT
jgi:hypothetical protein